MISQNTIQKVFDAVRIEEVIGEFVNLKKRGTNMLGLCPFHHEKTPSFSVSPTKGIYKCFGCGEAGNSVNFLMEQEQMNYPEAIRWLAQRYNIEVEETGENLDELKAGKEKRESLILINEFAQKFYADQLSHNQEGKSIGLSYFKERDISSEMIQSFGLGYSLNQYSAFADAAIKAAYKRDSLLESGLVFDREGGNTDRFRGRVMFPIRNLSGRVIAFGGRILQSDNKKLAKYINSPETEIYSKSKVLYGLFEAKKAIRSEEKVLLLEGYTDVIRLHQIEMRNAVSTSGTALTQEQARLLRRFTESATLIFDGDPAGLKAALRGVDILLEEDLNVNVVLLPEGEDPDSYARKLGKQGFLNYLESKEQGLITFKIELLLADAEGDPVQRAEVIGSVVASIACIPGSIKRATFLQKAAKDLGIDESILLQEVNNKRLKKKGSTQQERSFIQPKRTAPKQEPKTINPDVHQESDLIRILLNYGHFELMENLSVAQHIVSEFTVVEWDDPALAQIFIIYREHLEQGKSLKPSTFINHPDPAVTKRAINIMSGIRPLSSNWLIKHDIVVKKMADNFRTDVESAVTRLKLKKIRKMIGQNEEALKDPNLNIEQVEAILEVGKKLTEMKMELAARKGSVIIE